MNNTYEDSKKLIADWAFKTLQLIESLKASGLSQEVAEGHLKIAYTIASLDETEFEILKEATKDDI